MSAYFALANVSPPAVHCTAQACCLSKLTTPCLHAGWPAWCCPALQGEWYCHSASQAWQRLHNAVSLLTQLAALLTKQACHVSTACKGHAHAIGTRPTCSSAAAWQSACARSAQATAPITHLFRPLLQIQHQNEINDAFFLADALTKRCARVLGQPAGPCGCIVVHAACLPVAHLSIT